MRITSSPRNQKRTTSRMPDPGKVADFILFSQSEFLLNLSSTLSQAHLSFGQFFLLGYLNTSRQPSMTDIARKVGHSTAAATGLVDHLERLGHVERVRSDEDRRKAFVRLTPNGAALVQRMRSDLETKVQEAVKATNSSDLDSLMAQYDGDDTSHPKVKAKRTEVKVLSTVP